MHSLCTILILVALSCVSQVSSRNLPSTRVFSVDQVLGGTELRSGSLALMRAYEKYAHLGASAPANVIRAAKAAREIGTTSAYVNWQSHSQFFSIPVSVGDKTLNLQIDSGSSDLWVFSALQPANQTMGRPVYDPSKSTSAKKLDGYTWAVGYGDGSGASGVVYADKVVIGGVTATSQAVEAATSATYQFVEETFLDGLIGFGPSKLNQVKPKPQKTFFDTVKANLSQSLWAIDLKYDSPGSVDFGYLNPSKYTGGITYTTAYTSSGYWFIKAGSLTAANSTKSVSTQTTKASTPDLGYVLIDTGTPIAIIPSDIATAYYEQVEGAYFDYENNGFMFSCSTSLPDAEVSIGGAIFKIPGKYISYAKYPQGKCFGGIQPGDGFGFNILGDVFIKAVYTVFDETETQARIGFAAKPAYL